MTGAISGAAGGFANAGAVSGWGDAATRICAAALGGCIAGEVSGGNCSDGARKAAIAQSVSVGMEMYSKYQLSGAPAEGEPVVKVFGEGVRDPKVSNVGQSIEVFQDSTYANLAGTKLSTLTPEQASGLLSEYSEKYGYINKGKIFVENGVVGFGKMTEGSQILQGIARIPGMNGMAVFHDKWMANIHATSSLVLIPTIAPAIYSTYTGLGVDSYKYYARNLKK